MALKWGVDSSYYPPDLVVNQRGFPPRRPRDREFATAQESRDGQKFTLYDWVVEGVARGIGREGPDFWGRYLRYETSSSRDATRLTDREVTFIRERSGGQCKLLLVFNQISPLSCGQVGRAGYIRGWADAFNAVFAARQLRVPAGVRIYGDVEGWVVAGAWLWGWCDYMDRSEYAGIGGLYGRGREIRVPTLREQRDSWGRVVGRTYRQYERWHRQTISQHLELPYSSNDINRYPEHNAGVAVADARHLTGPSRINNLEGVPQEQRAAVQRRLGMSGLRFWTNMPRANRTAVLTADSHFMGLGPPSVRTVIWQYVQGEHVFDQRIDLNVATETGYADMWDSRNVA